METYPRDDNVVARLLAERSRPASGAKAATLVRRNFEAIAEARARPKGRRKTWIEIGIDLNPAAPIKADTVAKAFTRVSCERQLNNVSPVRLDGCIRDEVSADSAAEKEAWASLFKSQPDN